MPKFLDDRLEKFVRDLCRDARAVACPRIGVQGAPVHQVADGAQADAQDLVRAFATDPGDHSHPAGILFESRVIK